MSELKIKEREEDAGCLRRDRAQSTPGGERGPVTGSQSLSQGHRRGEANWQWY